jgi:hypothetical protein
LNTESPAQTMYSFGAGADASVFKKSPRKNYGGKATLLADAEPVAGAYLRFTVSGVEGTVKRARLRLWPSNGSGNGPTVYPTATGLPGNASPWPESAITWNKRPARAGGALDDLGSVAPGRFVEFDVSKAVDGNGVFSFELAAGSTDGTDFASSEATNRDRRPKLIVEVTPPPQPAAAPSG